MSTAREPAGPGTAARCGRSRRYARRARAVAPGLVRCRVPCGSHHLINRADDVRAVTTASPLDDTLMPARPVD
jgi:hypothetical protein